MVIAQADVTSTGDQTFAMRGFDSITFSLKCGNVDCPTIPGQELRGQ